MNASKLGTDEQGFTLVELLVVMLLLGVVGGVVINAVVTGLDAQVRTTDRLDALHELEIAMQRASRDLRAASPLELSTTEPASQSAGVRFRRAGKEWLVVYEVVEDEDAGTKELIQNTTVDGTITERRLVTRIDNEDADGNTVPVFSYFRADGTEIDCDNTASGDAGASCRSALLLSSSVRIDLVRDIPDAEAVEVSTSVSVRSVRYRS